MSASLDKTKKDVAGSILCKSPLHLQPRNADPKSERRRLPQQDLPGIHFRYRKIEPVDCLTGRVLPDLLDSRHRQGFHQVPLALRCSDRVHPQARGQFRPVGDPRHIDRAEAYQNRSRGETLDFWRDPHVLKVLAFWIAGGVRLDSRLQRSPARQYVLGFTQKL
jgi:hypothetical protein